MADQELSALSAVTGLDDNDLAYLASGGNPRKITGANLKAAMASALSTTYQPLDSDLTSIAALSTTSFGRSLLTLANAAALLAAAGAQGADATLDTYAGIDPSANVQSVLGAADYAAIRTLLGLVIGTDVQAYDADLTTATAVAAAILNHSNDATSVHGIADTSALLTTVVADDIDAEAANDGQVLTSDGAGNTAWENVPAGGTVAADEVTFAPAGTIAATDVQAAVEEAASEAATNLSSHGSDTTSIHGIADTSALLDASDIGSSVQAHDADLDTYAGITPSANVQSVLSAADYAAIRTLLGLVIGTNVQAYDADLTTYASITPSANVQSVLGAADYAAIRTLLGLVIGTNVQAYDAELAALAGLTSAADKGIQFTGSGTAATFDLTAAAKTVLDDTTVAAMLATLGGMPALLATNAQSGTTYTLAATDANLCVEMSNASAITCTVPLNATVAIPVGTVIALAQMGAGQVTFAPSGGVTIRSPSSKLKLTGQYSSAAIRKRATDEWVLAGDLTA